MATGLEQHFRGMAASFSASWDGSVGECRAAMGGTWWPSSATTPRRRRVIAAIRKIVPVGGLIIDGGAPPIERHPFFWAHLVPEKELVLALSRRPPPRPSSLAVSGLKSFIEEGSGIAFTLAAERVEVKKKSSLS